MSAKRSKKKDLQKHSFHRVETIVAVLVLGVSVYFIYPYVFPKSPHLPQPPLKDLAAAHNVHLGMLTNPRRLGTKPYTQILTSQYAFVTSDGEIHWDQFRPSQTEYDYREMDKLVAYGEANNMPVQAHHLVWNEEDSLPGWLKDGQYSRQQLLDIMHSHISTTVGHYKGRVAEWTVVNEAFTRAKRMYGLSDWWGDRLGSSTDYIDDAFRWARAADPNAKLILNDFYNETATDVADAQYDYLKAAKARGVPIDGIGMQMHIDATRPLDKAAIIKNMQRFGELGFPVYVTEFNVHAEMVKGSADHKAQLEAQITADVVRACIESKSCVSFTVFGQTDRAGFRQWITRHKTPSHLFTPKYQPKPSFYAFHDAWMQL
jgi:endo-1,4-beta-xylanase